MALSFYDIDKDYVMYLQEGETKERGFTRVPNVEYPGKLPKFTCGVVLEINDCKYYVPVSSFKTQKPDNILIKIDSERYNKVKGTLRFNYMFPVPDNCIKERIIALRNHGGAVRYHHDEIGVNSRLDEIQAAILRVKLPHIKEWNEKRRENAYRYNELFASCEDIVTPKELDNTYCVYHQYTVKIPNRDNIHKMLQEKGIGAMLYYPIPLHLQKVHEYLGVGKGSLPVTEKNTECVISLPMFPELTEEEQKTVASTLIECVEQSKALA